MIKPSFTMRYISYCMACTLAGSLCLSARTDESWANWLNEKKIRHERSKERAPEARIAELGLIMGTRSRIDSDAPLFRERIEIYDEIQSDLLQITGHAEYYGNRIMETYVSFRKELQESAQSGRLNDYLNESMDGFNKLAQLPSPETVRVLGEMLKEDWIYEADTKTGDDALRVQLSGSAGAAMQKLPLLDAPTSNLQADWRAWYAEVKSGERSFAFRGQPVSYRFKVDGSVETTARDASQDPPDPLSESARPAEASRPDSGENPPSATSTGVFPWVAGGVALLLAALITFFLKTRK